MASSSGTLCSWSISLEEAIRIIQTQESDAGGLSSDEESDLDQQLYDMDKNQRQVLRWSSTRLALHVLRLKNVVLKGQVFVIWIGLPAIETCILVEIDLQVYIFACNVGFTGSKVCFFHIFLFARWDVNFACFSKATQFLCIFSFATLELQFFNGTVVCCKKPSYFFLSFIFGQSFKYFLYFFHVDFLCLSEEKILLLFPVYYL